MIPVQKPIRRQFRQGQTRYLPIVYDPGKIQGYDDQHVMMVSRCFITKVKARAIHYDTETGPYIAGDEFMRTKTYSSFRKAMKAGIDQLRLACPGGTLQRVSAPSTNST